MARGKYHEWLTPEGLVQVEGWARDGLTDEQIATNMGISPRTLYTWMERFPQIAQALKRGKEVVDREVENALLKRALGYEYEEVTEELARDPKTGQMVVVSTKRVVKQVLPDVTAQIFWLKNRKPQVWRDRHELVHDGFVGVQIIDDIGAETDDDDSGDNAG